MKNLFLKVLATQKLWLGVLLCCLVCGSGESYGQEKLSEGEKMLNRMKILFDGGKIDSARILTEKAMLMVEKGEIKEDSTIAKIYYQKGACEFLKHTKEAYLEAEKYLLKSKKMWEDAVGENNLTYVTLWLDALQTLYQFGNLITQEEQLKNTKKLLALRTKLRGKPHYNDLRSLGTIYLYAGNFKEARENLEQAAMIAKNELGDNDRNYGVCIYYLAIAYLWSNDYVKSEKLFIECVTKKIPDATTANSALGVFYNTVGNYKEAAKYFTKAMELAPEKQNMGYANSLVGLADVYNRLGDYRKAEPLYLESLAITKILEGEKGIPYINCLSNLGSLYSDHGQFTKAEEGFKKVLKLSSEMHGENKDFSITKNALALLYLHKGEYAKAYPLLQEAAAIERQSLGYNLMYVLVNLAHYHWFTNNLPMSSYYFKVMQKNIMTEIANNFYNFSENEKLEFYQAKKPYIGNFGAYILALHQQKSLTNFPKSSLDSLTTNLFDLQLSTKGILLQSSQKMKTNILNSQDNGLITLFGQWEKQRKQLIDYEKLSLADKAKNKINIDSLAEATNSIEKQLSAKSENFTALADKKQYTWQDIQQALQTNEVAVEIIRVSKFGVEKVLTDSSDTEHFKAKGFYPKYDRYGLTDTTYYAALLVSKNTKNAPELVILENGNDLETKHFQFYRDTILSGRGVDLVSYWQFWQKIANSSTFKALQNKPKVYVSLDGIYHKINLHTLYNPQTKTYLSNEIAIQQVSNLKEIITNRNKISTTNKEITLLGFPNYDLNKEKRQAIAQQQALARATKQLPTVPQIENNSVPVVQENQLRAEQDILPPLSNTREEVLQIAQQAKQSQWTSAVYLDSAALEETVRHANNPRVLHIATHGFFKDNKANTNFLTNSGLYLAGANLSKNGREKLSIDDLLANKNAEDGILTAAEAMNLSLDKTDLVVLSACETGLGEVSNGEGVYGLQRAFMVAGSKAVLCSLWTVDDLASEEFMKLFYTQYFATGNKGQAFKTAQEGLQKNKKFAHPYFWGAFVLIGN